MELLSLSEERLIILLHVMNNSDENNNFFISNIRTKSGFSWSSWEKSQWDVRIEANFRILHSTQLQEEDWPKIKVLSLNSLTRYRNHKWRQLYKWFERYSRCWISTQWTIPRYQSNSVFSHLIQIFAKPFFWNAEPQKRTAKYLGHTWYIGKRFLQIQRRLLQHLMRKNRIHGSLMFQNTHHRMWWMKIKH